MKSTFPILLLICLLSCKDEGPVDITPCADALEGWEITSFPFPSAPFLNDMHFPTAETGFAVGNNGYIFKTTNGGEEWTLLEFNSHPDVGYNPDALTKARLLTAYFVNPQIGFAAGEGEQDYFEHTRTPAVFVSTTDGGETWNKKYLWDIYTVYDLYFFDEERGVAIFHVKLPDNRWEIQLWSTRDAGGNWTHVELAQTRIDIITFVSTSSRLMIVGKDQSDNPVLWSTSDEGASWTSQPLPTTTCYRLYFIDDEKGFALCQAVDSESGVFQTKDGGDTWEEIESPFGYSSLIHFYSPQEGFVINPVYMEVHDPIESYAALNSYEVFETVDGGKEWKLTTTLADCRLEGLSSAPSNSILYCLQPDFIRFEKK